MQKIKLSRNFIGYLFLVYLHKITFKEKNDKTMFY